MKSLLPLLLIALLGEPYRLVLKDGTVLGLTAPPEAKKGRLVGTVAGSGTLVSVLPDEVDRELTGAANRMARPAGESPASVVPLRPSGGPALGDRVKLQVSAEEARRKLESASGTAKPEPTPTPDLPERAEPGSKRPPKDDEHLDRQGRGEAYWKARSEKLRRAVSDAAIARQAAEANVTSWEHAMPSGDLAIQTWARELTRLRGEADRARRDEKVLQKHLEDLSEEARKANAYPGWLR